MAKQSYQNNRNQRRQKTRDDYKMKTEGSYTEQLNAIQTVVGDLTSGAAKINPKSGLVSYRDNPSDGALECKKIVNSLLVKGNLSINSSGQIVASIRYSQAFEKSPREGAKELAAYLKELEAAPIPAKAVQIEYSPQVVKDAIEELKRARKDGVVPEGAKYVKIDDRKEIQKQTTVEIDGKLVSAPEKVNGEPVMVKNPNFGKVMLDYGVYRHITATLKGLDKEVDKSKITVAEAEKRAEIAEVYKNALDVATQGVKTAAKEREKAQKKAAKAAPGTEEGPA